MINADYIESRQFLKNAGCVVLEVWDVIQRHDGVKMNTVFNGEFVAGDKRANKSIKYEKLWTLSNIEFVWMVWASNHHVIEPMLATLEEF